MKINSSEVAKLAGVSRSTVSRVINNSGNVIDETRVRVLKAIEELNYVPNTNAQSLAGKKSSVIGLFIFEDDYTRKISSGYMAYYMNFITSVTKDAFSYKHQVLTDVICDLESEQRLKSLFVNGNISSGIFLGATMNNMFIDSFIQGDNRIALIDYTIDNNDLNKNVALINTADRAAGYEITSELIEMGCNKIMHIRGNPEKLSAVEREKGYLEAIHESSLTYQPELTLTGNYRENDSYIEVSRAINRNIEFDGIFAANDIMARGALKALNEHYITNIPLWGFDNIRGSFPLGIKSADPCLQDNVTATLKHLMNNNNDKPAIKYIKPRLIKTMDDYMRDFKI